MYVPRTLLGWGTPVNSWFSIDCSDCSIDYNCTRASTEDGHKPQLQAPIPAPEEAVEKMAEEDLEMGFDDHNPVKCCAYAKKEYYYAKGAYCVLLHGCVRVVRC